MRPVLFLTILSAVLWSPGSVHAATIDVPGDVSTIQAAINSARDGDVVQVAPGTYEETLDFHGKAVTVRSHSGADSTVIDGNQAGSVVTFIRGETAASVLRGFTIRNGAGTPSGEPGRTVGGGLFLSEGSSPTIRSCTITGNTAYYGGGLFCGKRSAPAITDCTITANIAAGLYSKGGGLYCRYASPAVTDCRIAGNSGGEGGGVYCSEDSAPLISNCTISDNAADGGIVDEQFGGGISCYWYAYPTIANCVIEGNSALHGGGLFASWYSSPRVENTEIIGNTADWGAGIAFFQTWFETPRIRDSVIAGNTADWSGGAVGCVAASPRIENCTITGNGAAGEGGGLHVRIYSTPMVTNSILWGDSALQGPELWVGTTEDPSELVVAYSDVQGGVGAAHIAAGSTLTWLDGNIEADPLFAGEEDYALAPGSPCIDAGDPASSYDDECFPPSMGNDRNDMGAYGGSGGCGWICWDVDGDGYHDEACGGVDCDDTNPNRAPGFVEVCDGIDNDCSGTFPASEIDADGDGFRICEFDCDDGDPETHPFAVELCDFKDNNCDGTIDEGPCSAIELLAFLGLAGCLLDGIGDTPGPEPETGGGGGSSGCALSRARVKSGLASAVVVYLIPVGFVLFLKRRSRATRRF